MVARTLKTALAAGVAYALASLLPAQLDQYAYYAPLGAVTVMYPAVADSLWQAAKAVAAVFIGVGLGVLGLVIAWPDALSVAVVVGVGTAIGGVAWFGPQRSWLALAALFVLTASQPNTEVYIAGYLSALPLGAAVGIAANMLLFPSLSLYELRQAVSALRSAVTVELQQMAEVLATGGQMGTARWQESLTDLAEPREHLRTVWADANRARTANLRTHRWTGVRRELIQQAEALERCSVLVEDVGVVFTEFESGDCPMMGPNLRHTAAEALNALVDVLEHPEQAALGSDTVQHAHASTNALLDHVDQSRFENRRSRLLAGSVAISTRRCVQALTRGNEETYDDSHDENHDDNAGAEQEEQLPHSEEGRLFIEQAKGILFASGATSMDQAIAALRSYASRSESPVSQVAIDLVNGTLAPRQLLDGDHNATTSASQARNPEQ